MQVYIRDCTMVSVYSLLLFAGNHISIDLDRGNLILSVDDGWIRFMASSGQVGISSWDSCEMHGAVTHSFKGGLKCRCKLG